MWLFCAQSSCSASSGSSGHLHMTSTSSKHQHVTSPCSTPTFGTVGFGYPYHPSVSPQSSISGGAGGPSSSQTSGSTLGFSHSHGGSLKITASKTPTIKLKRSGSSASSNQGSGSKGSGSTSGASGAGSGCSGGGGNLASPGSVPGQSELMIDVLLRWFEQPLLQIQSKQTSLISPSKCPFQHEKESHFIAFKLPFLLKKIEFFIGGLFEEHEAFHD